MIQNWPMLTPFGIDGKDIIDDFETVQQVIAAVRNLRSDYKVEPAKKVKAILIAGKKASLLKENSDVLKTLARLEVLEVNEKGKKPKDCASVVAGGVEVCLPLEGLVDAEKERARLEGEKDNLTKYIKGLEAKLSNKEFTDKAPKEVVEKNRKILEDKKDELTKVEAHLSSL